MSEGAGGGRVLGDAALQSTTLEEVASAVRYHRWLTDLARPHLGDHPLEIGSGLGDYAQTWLDSGVPRITVSDLEPSRLAGLRARYADDPRVDVRELDVIDDAVPEDLEPCSALVAFNVLEHVPDDVGALRGAQRFLRPGAAVVLFVPAFPFAMSEFDLAVGHVRRYTVPTLTRSLVAAGLDPVEVRYVNMPGLAAWTVGMKWLRMTPGEGPLLRVWDGLVVPVARAVEERVRAPFGQSVLAVARVPGGAASSSGRTDS